MPNAILTIPDCYTFLLEPARYKVVYGGRNAGKDWSTIHVDLLLAMLYDPARTESQIKSDSKALADSYGVKPGLIETSMRKPHRILYGREVMTSIKRSVYTTIKDRIMDLGIASKWIFRDDQIQCINGSIFFFAGLYKDPHNIKSMEGITLCRVVEAENVSDESWRHLIPTIRAKSSEILVSFNTRYQDDPTYQRWVVSPPKGTIVKKVNSTDIEGYPVWERDENGNYILDAEGAKIAKLDEDGKPLEQYLSKEAKQNRENDYQTRRWEYDNVWLGEPLMAGRKIYPMFDETIHCKHFDMQLIKPKANFFMAMDPAQKYYPFCLWMALFPDEFGSMIKYIYAEYPSYDDLKDYYDKLRTTMVCSLSTKELATQFIHRGGEAEWGLTIKARFIDTRFAAGTGGVSIWSTSTKGIIDEFLKRENGGLSFECPETSIIDIQRQAIIKDFEVNNLLPISERNHSSLYIDPACVNLIRAFKNHRLEDKSEREHPKYKDAIDTCRILFAGCQDPKYRWVEPGRDEVKLEYKWGRRGDLSEDPDGWMGN